MGLDALLVVASYAVYRVAKNYLDQQRGLSESELRAMFDQVETLVKTGWSRDKALAAVLQVSKEDDDLAIGKPSCEGCTTSANEGDRGNKRGKVIGGTAPARACPDPLVCSSNNR